MKIKNKKDFGLGVFSILFSALVFYLSMQLKMTNYAGDPGPRMFPIIGAVIMFLCGIALIIKPDPAGAPFLTGRQWLAAGKIFLMYILMIVLLYFLGFIVAVPVTLFVLTFILSKLSMSEASTKKRLLTSLIYAIVAGAVIYAAYVLGLKAVLPDGLLWESLGMV